jgi:phosphatidylglycerol lysyltransferase
VTTTWAAAPDALTVHDEVRRLIDAHGDNPFDEFALAADKQYVFSPDRVAVVAFATWRGYALTLSDPIGPVLARAEAVDAFIAHCEVRGWEPVFYEVGPESRALYEARGFRVFKIGEQARITLADYSLKGPKFQKLRASSYRAGREGYTFRWYHAEAGIEPAIEAGMKRVSDAWLKAKRGREMGFDMGVFDLAEIRRRPVPLALNATGEVQAFATWLPYRQGRGRCLDLMRNDSPVHGLMDFVIVESIRAFRAQGVEEVSLANAPLANLQPPVGFHERVMRWVYLNFNWVYGYRTLFEFKKKYLPAWRGSYLAYRRARKLPGILCAMTAVHMPDGLRAFLCMRRDARPTAQVE